MILNPAQEAALKAVGAARDLERAEIQRAKKDMWAGIHAGARAEVRRQIEHALSLGVPKSRLKTVLRNKSDKVFDIYLSKH